jgi:hypothetical protein
MFTNPRGSGYGGFANATFFRPGKLITAACSTASGPAPQPVLKPNGETTCPVQKQETLDDIFGRPPGTLQRSQPAPAPQVSPSPRSNTGTEGVVNDVKRRLPGGLGDIFR